MTQKMLEEFAKVEEISLENAREFLRQAKIRLDGTLPVPYMPGSIVHRAVIFLQRHGYEWIRD